MRSDDHYICQMRFLCLLSSIMNAYYLAGVTTVHVYIGIVFLNGTKPVKYLIFTILRDFNSVPFVVEPIFMTFLSRLSTADQSTAYVHCHRFLDRMQRYLLVYHTQIFMSTCYGLNICHCLGFELLGGCSCLAVRTGMISLVSWSCEI